MLDLDQPKLARFFMYIEQGYPQNPYHNASHAADVLRNLHVILTRGGALAALSASAQAENAKPSGQVMHVCFPSYLAWLCIPGKML